MHRLSYWKTVSLALAVSLFSLGEDAWLMHAGTSTLLIGLFESLLFLAFAVSFLVASGGLICLWRDAREAAGLPDLFVASANQVAAEKSLARVGLGLLRAPRLRPGELVQVLPLKDIQATLDGDGALDGLPFMAEMESSCGRIFRVHRRVDKIHDMRHKTGHRLRRMMNTVTLTEVRCSGCHHGGCEAECQILWKDAWLRRIAGRNLQSSGWVQERVEAVPVENVPPADTDQTYVCQMTRLWEASRPMVASDLRQDFRPLLSGNLGIGAFLLGVLTGVFNWMQALRGGVGYPYMPECVTQGQSPTENLALTPKELVVVRGKEEIARTLVQGRNRGLWFDRDMIRFCGKSFVVRKRVSRVIHEGTGKMVVLTTPAVVLESVMATGEFLRFCPQHEFLFWRENWLQRVREESANAAE